MWVENKKYCWELDFNGSVNEFVFFGGGIIMDLCV